MNHYQKTNKESCKSLDGKQDQFKANHRDKLLKLPVKDLFMTQQGCVQQKESDVIEATLLKTRSQIKFGSKIKNLNLFSPVR